MARPHGRARVDAAYPQAFAVCDRCGFWYNHVDLNWQFEFSGRGLYNTRFLFCERCTDDPQPQLKSRRIKGDPRPILNARPEPFSIDNYSGFTLAEGAFGPALGPAFGSGGILALVTLQGYPTSAAGLSPGSVWADPDSLIVSVVPGVVPWTDPVAPARYYGGETSAPQLLQYGGGQLPLTDPLVVNQLWNNGGTVYVSAGS